MKKTFLICSLVGRTEGLLKLISSLTRFDNWYVCVVLQKYPPLECALIADCIEAAFPSRSKMFCVNEMTGPHLARMYGMDRFDSDIWCILDDDIYAVKGYTDYNKMAEILWERKDIGILSSNWRKTEGMLKGVQLKDELKSQKIVYTGGGMMLRADCAEIIKAIPRTQYLFDNPLWSIYLYVNGYSNFRYMGSASVHQVCSKGGRRKWIKEGDKAKSLPPAEWIRTRKGKGSEGGFDEYLICDSTDVTAEANLLHRKNRRRPYETKVFYPCKQF